MAKRFQKKGAPAPFSHPTIEVQIQNLAVGGAGIARHDGMVIFVPMAAPGDRLLVRLTKKKKNYAEAEIVEILSPGPSRREPPCPVANTCGGCNWQHISEDEQRRQKQDIVEQTLRKFLRGLDFQMLPIVSSPQSLRYRNRIQPKAYKDFFGFFGRQSHRIVDINDCLITEESITEKFAEIRKWVSPLAQDTLQKMEVFLSDDLSKVQYNLINDEDDTIGFSQVNRFQNKDLIETALDWSGEDHYDTVFDLYSGAGNFTFPLASRFRLAKKIQAVELNPKLVLKGLNSTSDNRIHFLESDVEKYITKALISSNDLVVLDPPRAGASLEVMKKLAASAPKKIIYISCHPVSLARDLQWLLEESNRLGTGLRLARVQTFEMFPQTDHVETIAELKVDS